MRGRAEWRSALALLAASAGVGLASGRELMLFFGQFKAAAWAGVIVAAVTYGLLAGFATSRQGALATGRDALSRLRIALRMLLAALVAALMLEALGRVGALTLPVKHGYGFGAAFGLFAALVLARCDDRGFARLGLLIALYAGAFFAACAADPRPAAPRAAGDAAFLLAGDVRAAALLATVYAAMNACAAEWALDARTAGCVRPAAVGAKSALLLGGLLAAAVFALQRGGDAVMAQPMPWVLLSARWGLTGFWLCAGLQALCAAATLSAALRTLVPRSSTEAPPAALSISMLIISLIVFAILSA